MRRLASFTAGILLGLGVGIALSQILASLFSYKDFNPTALIAAAISLGFAGLIYAILYKKA